MAFTFEQLFAADPSNPSNIAQNASIVVFEPGDATMVPLTLTDPDGQPLANPLTVNANGFGPAFAHATLDRVAWAGGGFTGFMTSYEGMKAEATAARTAAETAKNEAVAAAATTVTTAAVNGSGRLILTKADTTTVDAGPVIGPAGPRGDQGLPGVNSVDNDTAVAGYVNNSASATNAALNASIGHGRRPANVRDAQFGAVGDGIANDTAAINAALATDRDVYLPPGTYRIAAATGFALLNTQKRRSIYGSGIGTTVLKLDSGGEGGVIDATGATLSDLSIDGGFNPATAQSNLLSCVQANSNSTVRNVHIYNARGSCLVGVGSRIAFINNRLEKFGDHAIYFSGDIGTAAPFNVLQTSSRLVVQGNIIDDDPTYHNGAAGGPVRGAVKFRNNIIDAVVTGNTIAGDQCILIDGDTRRAEACPRRIVVTGNTLLASYSGLQINTAIDATAGDTGIRVSEVTVSGNTIYGSDADNTGVLLSRARASITNNTFTTTAGIGNFETGDTGASVITGNTFRGGVTGIYKAGTGSLVEGNMFDGLTGGWAVQCTYHHTVRGNVFTGCATAAVVRTSTHATNALLIQDNTFMNNTLALDIGEFARSVALLDNTFTGNTTTATVVAGSAFNAFTVANNRVISGGAFPVTGSGDSIALAPVTPISTVSALPAAASSLRGRLVRVVGAAGVADQAYICRKNAADAYEWAPVL